MDIGVLALQGEVGAHLRAFERLGVNAQAVRTPAELRAVDALVVPGGESTTMWMMAARTGCAPVLADRLAAGLPTFGTCAGMIMLAADLADGRADQGCFGAIDVSVRRNAFGRQLASFEAEVDVSGLEGGPFHGVFIRAPWIERVGEGVEVLARVPKPRAPGSAVAGSGKEMSEADRHAGVVCDINPDRPVQYFQPEVDDDPAVVCVSGNVLVTSFHPELTDDLRLHRYFLERCVG